MAGVRDYSDAEIDLVLTFRTPLASTHTFFEADF
jgi:hypothetical protein